MPKTLQLKLSPHKHTMQTKKKAGVLIEEPEYDVQKWYVREYHFWYDA